MSTQLKRGVPFSTPPMPTLEERMPDWHAAWVFLELHRSGSIRACARRLTMTISSIRRRVEELEVSVGQRLMTRHTDGIRVTPEGEELIKIIERMESEAIKMLRLGDFRENNLEGSVRIAVTEGLGAAWLTPHLPGLHRTSAKLRVDLVCGMTSVDVLRMEADLAVQLTRPQAQDVKVVRLGYLHVMPYAAPAYLREFGKPETVEQLATHRLVLQIAEQTSAAENLARIFGDRPFTGTVAMTTNFSTANALAIVNRVGIGWLPTYVTPTRLGLIPIECDAEGRFDVWLTYHPDVEKIPRVRHTIEWIRSIFDARRFPAFGERRIHPSELPEVMQLEPLTTTFQDFGV